MRFRRQAEQGAKKRTALYVDDGQALIDQLSLLILFQPICRFAVWNTLKTIPLSAVHWEAALYQGDVKRSPSAGQ